MLFFHNSELKKKLVAASNKTDCKDLAPWVRSVTNHMWWSCCSSKGDAKVYKHNSSQSEVLFCLIYLKFCKQLMHSKFLVFNMDDNCITESLAQIYGSTINACVVRSCTEDGRHFYIISLGSIAGKKTEHNTNVSIRTCQQGTKERRSG